METGIPQTLILLLLLGEQALGNLFQILGTIIMMILFDLLMSMCMTRQHHQSGVLIAWRDWM